MKRNLNWSLFLVFIISLLMTLKYSQLPVWSTLPDKISNWFVISEKEVVDYVFLYDLFMGICTSYIFYIFIEFIPNKIHNHDSKKLLSYDIELLLRDMKFVIDVIKYIFGINIPIKDISEKDLLIINDKININKKGFFLEEVFSNKLTSKGKRITGIETSYEYPKCINNTLKQVNERLKNISSKEGYYSIDSDFAKTIILLKDNRFISWYKNGDNSNECFIFSNTSSELIKFINLYKKLVMKRYHDRYRKFTFLTDEEVNNRPKILEEVNKIVNERNKEFQKLNPCLIYNGLDNNSKIIANRLINIFGSQEYMITNEGVPKLDKNNLVVVVLGTGLSKMDEKYERLLEGISFEGKHVIILKQYVFIRNSSCLKMIKNQPSLSNKVVYFKTSVKIKSIYIYKEHPNPNQLAFIYKEIIDFIDSFIEKDNN